MNKGNAAAAIESICFQVAKLDGQAQSAFIDNLRGVLTESELQAMQIGIAYFRMIINGDLRKAMQAELAAELYKQFRQQIES